MYGFKEKTKYFNELHNPAAAEADLRLLRASAPAHPKLKMFARNPLRYADDILYTLLDIKSKTDIRLNRREYEPEAPAAEADPKPEDESPEDKSKEEIGKALEPKEKNSFEIEADIVEKQAELELKEKEKQEAKERAEQAEDQAEVLEQENQELKEELETEQDARAEAEERAEQAEQALEEEKKKEPTKVAPRSKSTKSTRKLTGKTSKTKTSK